MDDPDKSSTDIILTRLARFNATFQGLVSGILLGSVIFLATNWLIVKGGRPAGPHLALLGQYFIGYRVSFIGSLIGFCYGFVVGFAAGYLLAWLYNWFVVKRERRRERLRGRHV
jgi:hypothetical protein